MKFIPGLQGSVKIPLFSLGWIKQNPLYKYRVFVDLKPTLLSQNYYFLLYVSPYISVLTSIRIKMQPSRTTTFFKVRRSTALPWGKTGTSVQRVATLRRTSVWATSQAVSRILFMLFCPLCSRQTTPLSHPGLPVGGQWPFCVVFYYVLPLYFVPHRTCARQSHMFCAPWTSPDLSSIKSAWRPSPQQEEWPQLCPATVKFRDALQQEATATVLWWPVLPAGWLLLLFGTLLILCQITLSSYKYKINFFFFF